MSTDTPWVAGDLVIEADALRAIEAHALEAYPSECCGWLTGPADEPRLLDEVVREENQADKLHELDPVTYPRTSHTYFALHALRFERARAEGSERGHPVKVVYHSHCDAGAYFSEEDAATFTALGNLSFPVAFIVVSVIDGELRDRKLHVFDGEGGFVESPLEVRRRETAQ